MTAALLALDWGTTSLRAYRLAADGTVLDRRSGSQGIQNVPNAAFAAALEAVVGDWWAEEPGLPAIAAGMIGSRQGWREVPYVACPAGPESLAGALLPIALGDGRTLHLAGGLSCVDAHNIPDVMRGEETQILGAIPPGGSGVLVLPGTHSKWARVEQGRVTRFATFMTGEVYGLLAGHSILAHGIDRDAPFQPERFEQGVRAGIETGAGLLHTAFGVRASGLFGRLDGAGAASYLSGLVIGTEIAGVEAAGLKGDGTPIVIANADLTARYLDAFRAAGFEGVAGPDEAAARGLHRLALAAGLMRE
ncbi:2-dehydro-3-deoxygalactonokinase [Marinivivus vitaminiproducens]|uniref:2-dehydro-3-deoxygalactonokinase n=1 Tax=Marinivivus vitaminiproducens TaxID=3035935 RepID=UPI0027A7B18F|nr:2-dehydro-3-deoxygalactonokinase [Geminicoccaceae bacterium SCSIO 64248]